MSYLDPDSRPALVVIEGPGGVGKSSLALEVAHQCKEQGFFDLIVWTTAQERLLSEQAIEKIQPEIKVLDDILEAVARAAGQPVSDLLPLEKRAAVLRILGSMHCLIIVDNFETVKDESISQFLRLQMPSPSKVVVTSRLGLRAGESIRLKGMSSSEARDFVKSVVSNRKLANVSQVADNVVQDIWEWSGGIPLAMRWLVSQASSKLVNLENLAKSLPDVTNGELLQFCFKEIYDQLKTADKITLQALTLFRSPISRDALAAISDIRGVLLTEAIEDLWQKSLIEFDDVDERYSLLPLTRRFARSRSVTVKYLDTDTFFTRAADYFSSFVAQHNRDYERLEKDIDNIFAILSWCISKKQSEEIFEIVCDITWYLGIRGMGTQRLHYAEEAVTACLDIGLEEESMWIQAFDIGWVKLNRGLYDETDSLYSSLLEKSLERGYLGVAALCYRNLALMKRRQFREAQKDEADPQLLDEAWNLAHKSLTFWLQVGDEYWIAITRGTIGSIAMQQGRYEEAQEQYYEAMKLDRKNDNLEGVALAKSNLGRVAIKLENYDQALTLIDEAMEIDRTLKRVHGIAAGLQRKAYVYDRLGNHAGAMEMLQDAKAIYQETSSFPRLGVVQRDIELLERKILGETEEPLF